MNALYPVDIMHMRLEPHYHRFCYPVFMMAFDLETLEQECRKYWCLSRNKWNLFSIEDHDHMNLGAPEGIKENLFHWLEEHHPDFAFKREELRVAMVTFPRVLGYGFFPASFFYLSQAGKEIGVVVEVMNTFQEKKLFLVEEKNEEGVWYARVPKNFYVSPFSDPGWDFEFLLGPLGQEWEVKIHVFDGEKLVVTTLVEGEQVSLTSSRLFWYAWKYPFLSFWIIFSIHWHAFLLWLRGVPFFRKEERQEAQTDLYHPYRGK